MRFETINGTLCRMVEPTSLHPDSKMPCMVTRIEDGEIGRYTKWHISGLIGEKLVATSIVDGNVVFTDKTWNICNLPYLYFEIIGYPVADGSKEWRNYQLVQGKCVYRPGDSEYYQASGQGRIIGKLIENNEFNSTWNSDTFMRDDSDGWQIYEPVEPPKEPETLAEIDAEIAKERKRVARWKYADHSMGSPEPVADGDNCKNKCSKQSPNIDHCVDFVPKEKPEPKYKVGDSVICEYHRSPLPKQISYERVIDVDDVTVITQSQNGYVCAYDINGNHGDINGWHIDRVISPCEHIVTIGCLSGTVEPVSTNGIHIWFHLIGVDDKTIATIRISSLDTQTRELVESLIKGQEEEK